MCAEEIQPHVSEKSSLEIPNTNSLLKLEGSTNAAHKVDCRSSFKIKNHLVLINMKNTCTIEIFEIKKEILRRMWCLRYR